MDIGTTVLIILLVIAVLGLVMWGVKRRRSTHLRERFGPEYDRTVSDTGDRREAEATLAARERRHRTFDLKELDADAVERYRMDWREVQTQFVDDPSTATHRADRLITRVMVDRGYPMEDMDQRSADLSVEHPEVVSDYRSAHGVAVAHQDGRATTEDLREAMVHYRSLFERLITPTDDSRDGRGDEDHRREDGRQGEDGRQDAKETRP